MKKINLILLLMILSLSYGCTADKTDNNYNGIDDQSNKVITENKNDNEMNKVDVVNNFLQTLNSNQVEGFQEFVSKSGLVVIRNFISGNGTRGKNIRDLYLSEEIPQGLMFPVEGEIPINPKELFTQSLDMELDEISVVKVEDINFNFADNREGNYQPTTNEIWEICDNIIASAELEELNGPVVLDLGGKELVLAESFDEFSTGSWAVFEKHQEQFYLKAIIDFR